MTIMATMMAPMSLLSGKVKTRSLRQESRGRPNLSRCLGADKFLRMKRWPWMAGTNIPYLALFMLFLLFVSPNSFPPHSCTGPQVWPLREIDLGLA